jgi:uncharacterized Zn finger protein (UPF0148 family)
MVASDEVLAQAAGSLSGCCHKSSTSTGHQGENEMPGFCRNCGSPLADGQAFCVKCGTRVGEVSLPSAGVPAPAAAVPPPSPPVYAAPAQSSAPVAPTKTSPLVKILVAVVLVFVAFGAIAVAAMMYIGHRIHQKAEEFGLNRSPEEIRESQAALSRIDGCALLSKADVTQAVKMDVVRAESTNGNPGCTYSVSGDAADLTAKHISALHKNQLNKSQQENVENFGKTIFHGANSESNGNVAEHPGEAPVFSFSIDNNAPQLQMRLYKATLGRLGPSVAPDIPNLGDEAFDGAGAMLFVRKGDNVVRIMYMTCPCGLDDVLPLARKIVDGL